MADFVFHLEIGSIRIFSGVTFISFVVLCGKILFIGYPYNSLIAAQTLDLQKRYAVIASNTAEAAAMGYASDLQQKASRWRAERNWWIAALTFTIYWMSLRFHAIKRQLNDATQAKDKKA